jgi:hypothetical protein
MAAQNHTDRRFFATRSLADGEAGLVQISWFGAWLNPGHLRVL